VTLSNRPANTGWVDASGYDFMAIVASLISALGAPIPRYIEVARPDIDLKASGRILASNRDY
jgi:hypothetical protein